jgi:uncharacterized surface protein with fasciclin (FAS1) repeats
MSFKATAAALLLTLATGAIPAFAKDCNRAASYYQPAKQEQSRARGEQNIVAVAAQAGQFETLIAAVQAAGLADTLMGPGPFTVFAPTDEAFRALPVGTVDQLLRPENRGELARLLTYHVTPGIIRAGDLAGRTARPASVAGPRLDVDGRQGVSVNNARVIQADIRASNGIIHVIDRVLSPPRH